MRSTTAPSTSCLPPISPFFKHNLFPCLEVTGNHRKGHS
ncbi:hypothetical protein CGLO_11668 [Colletotrichum gloeosporioides Cg-14]|uniref:Uncharacterized protein n=1 Tax=Colletotrichum gloeosporioides (strain Cg-14) TaxID=1237896 RepID=T0K084_COLGC|nr:hypothetical protein CGLO_11668 [Colletotrichum gloeosporioides Cg-14]